MTRWRDAAFKAQPFCWNLSQAVLAFDLDRFNALDGSEEHRKGGGIQPSFAETARGVLRAERDVHPG